MNKKQNEMYQRGIGQQNAAGARMYGAMIVWSDMPTVPLGLRVRMKELIAEYEAGRALVARALEPAIPDEAQPQDNSGESK